MRALSALLAFVGLGVLEVWLMIEVAHAIGVLLTVALLLLCSVTGSVLLRRAGARALRSFVAALGERRSPHREGADGALVVVGGALMVVPGFATGAVGLLLMLPPSRALLRPVLVAAAARRGARMVQRGTRPGTIRVGSVRLPGTAAAAGHRVIDADEAVTAVPHDDADPGPGPGPRPTR